MYLKKQVSYVLLIIAVFIVTSTANAYGQVTSSTANGFSSSTLVADLASLEFWLMLVVTLFSGAIGGVVYELLILQGNIELPHKATSEEAQGENLHAITQYMLDLGVFSRIIIGAAAALASLLVVEPSTTTGLIATAIVAGSAGTSIFRSLQDRIIATMAQKENFETKIKANKQNEKVEEALTSLSQLKKSTLESTEEIMEGLEMEGLETLETEIHTEALKSRSSLIETQNTLNQLNNVEKLLHEAVNLHKMI